MTRVRQFEQVTTDVIASIAWCAGITLLSYLWAKRRYIRRAGDNAK